MKKQFSFKLPRAMSRTEFEAALAETTSFVPETSAVERRLIFDTFDWRLFNCSLTLYRSDDEYTLAPWYDGIELHCTTDSIEPVYVWDFPNGALRAQLGSIVKARALLSLANVYIEETSYRVLDDEQKTVVRLVCAQVQTEPDSGADIPTTYLSLRPLRGYEKHAVRLAEQLKWCKPVESRTRAILFSALKTTGQTPNSYTSQLDVGLKPTMRADKAAKAIFRRLLETMRANEEGIKADIDIEFLHDYRIAVRRTRSALRQIKGVFSTERTAYFRNEFRTLGKLTNDLRDLDVYLLAEADYRSLLPPAMHADITPLFDYLRSHRAEALASVIDGLEAEDYLRVLAEWEAFLLNSDSAKGAANAEIPVIELACKRIRRQFRRIIQDGTYALEHTEDENLHALRIDCKELRYFLEFFADLFPPKEMNVLIKQLKGLQDNLGEFTDLAVQQEYLLSVAESLDIDKVRARRALVATGFLVETMARRQRDVKAEFADAFNRFAALEHHKGFQKLIGGGKEGRKP